MSKFLDCNGVPLKVGDKVMWVNISKLDSYGYLLGTITEVKGLDTERGKPFMYHDPVTDKVDGLPSKRSWCKTMMKLQDLDDDEILQNNVLFSTSTNTWERITDYPKKPALEPELVPT